MTETMNPRLAKWEIETIEALARENLEKANRTAYIEHEESFTSRFITKLQTRCLTDATERKRLVQQADRLGVGVKHPPHITELKTDPYDVASTETSSRWIRIISLLFTFDRDHEWRALHHDLVTRHVIEARATGIEWKPLHEGIGILDVLETEATRLGLIDDEPAPRMDSFEVLQAMTLAIAGGTPRDRPTQPPADDDIYFGDTDDSGA